ncbi:NAD(P)H-binding protein [Actinomadura opuntiae]|uniref:NAD(P)H-binding protein n=1 Tax=Actinomadura sp. OS1-43 TaxID=604315 RepID=UPI00255B1DE5|nr:NAD(P)H-binding protein [Actinomadura sp. OS1-43]MDL4822062.1 NAD(P)H-binding protein [Actinomadura sp. OS1-43]
MLLVTGATGNIGRDLVRDLDAKGADVRILVRDPARAAGLPDRAERAVADLDEPATLPPAFAGAERLFLLTPGIGASQAANAVAAARAAGVRHIVLLSSTNVLGDPMPAMGRWHHERDEIVRASGIPSTILRPGGFMLNALEWLPTIREGGYVLDPIGPGRFAPIDTADIAAVAAAVLTEDGHDGETYALTGDELFTVAEQVAVLARAIGQDLQVREVRTPEEAVRARFPGGAPPALADALVEGFSLMRADTAGFRTDTVKRLTGRAPRTFADWCARNAATFRRPPGV